MERIGEDEANAADLISLERWLGTYKESRLQDLILVEDWIYP